MILTLHAFYLYLISPFVWLTARLLCLVWPKLRLRLNFEKKNKRDIHCQKFANSADVAFEISSEGEIEQVLPLMMDFIQRNKRVELIYCSPSVEHKVELLAKKYSEQLRVLRLPLLNYLPWGSAHQCLERWVTAPVLILCRYDFFPHLLILKAWGKKLFLVSATVINKKRPAQKKWYYQQLLSLFDLVLPASPQDFNDLKQWGAAVQEAYDFRIMQIVDRLEHKQQKTFFNSDSFAVLQSLLEAVPKQKRIIWGSFWANESAAFANPELVKSIAQNQTSVVIVPHQLDAQNLQNIQHQLEQQLSGTLPIYVWTEHLSANQVLKLLEEFKQRPGVLLLALKNILCEFYAYFGNAFVGGGHQHSIHSVLEPFVAGARVFCGPKTHRSTEFSFIQALAPDEVHVVEQLDQFYDVYKRFTERAVNIDRRAPLYRKNGEQIRKFCDQVG